ncbi:outer membrane beta-barrel protein [Flavobacteriales bacterium]|nr:outer membrane beta-barrel protein [Flavobacteriales bacterium]
MKNAILTIAILLISTLSFSQKKLSVGIFGGPNYSTFSFVNSQGVDESSNYEFINQSTFGIQLNIQNSKHIMRPSLGLRQAGAKSTLGTIPMTWSLNYLDLEAAYLYELIQKKSLGVSLGAGLYGGYLIGGEQTIGTKTYSLSEEKAFNPIDFGARAMTNIRFSITQTISVFGEYQFGYGLSQIENDETEQETRNRNQVIKIGLTIEL